MQCLHRCADDSGALVARQSQAQHVRVHVGRVEARRGSTASHQCLARLYGRGMYVCFIPTPCLHQELRRGGKYFRPPLLMSEILLAIHSHPHCSTMPPAQPTKAKGKGKAVAFFSDDEDFGEAGSPVPLAATNGRKRKHEPNGTPNGTDAGKKKKKAKKNKSKGGKDTEAERARIASELLLKRYELPFYQGRRNILDEIVKNDTVVVSRWAMEPMGGGVARD